MGCGYGLYSKQALESGFEVVALEPAQTKREIARSITGLEPLSCSFEELSCPRGSLDAILMSQVLEHVQDVDLWIAKARELLRDQGILAIAVPNYGSVFRKVMKQNDPFIIPPAHLNYFCPSSLTTLLAKHGFGVERMRWFSWMRRSSLGATSSPIPGFAAPAAGLALQALLRVVDRCHAGMFIDVLCE